MILLTRDAWAPVSPYKPDFLLRWREVFNLYLRNIPVKFGKNPVYSFWEVFVKEKVYKRTHARKWLSLYKSIINRIIKQIRIH